MRLSGMADRAVDYILGHLKENLSVEEVADHCHFSKFHFSRLFKMETGESPYAFIRRLRLEESAFCLKVEPERRVTDIGWDWGYSSSNYSWTFRRQFGINPADFRRSVRQASFRHPFCHLPEEGAETLLSSGLEVRVMPDFFVVYDRYIGDYHELGRIWQRFLRIYQPWRRADAQFLVRSFTDPVIANSEACLFDVCMTVPLDCPLANTAWIPGGAYLVCPFRGPTWNIFAAYQALFNLWLPRSAVQIDGQYTYDLYHHLGGGPENVEMDICLALRRDGSA